ncbi:MAG TPA: exodeoxyribonuclease V subunit gamma [Kofleriaceae bacterium]|jgi:exodeoxyribonuclease V gamma subunit
MALRVVHGDRAEGLFAALAASLPPADPFAPATIVTGSHLVARWLRRELAQHRGIATGLDLVTFDRFVVRTWGDPSLLALDRDQLAAAIASALADPRVVGELPAVAAYLRAAPGDVGPRRVQLAEHVAHLVWGYALARPAWLPALIAGRVPGELESDPNARWQASLVGEALRRLDARAAPIPMLPWLRRRAELPAPKVKAPITAFGASYLVRAQLEALTDLAQTTDVTVYLLDPCEELWDDVAGRASATTSTDPLLLSLWGRAVRGTLGALVERSGGDVEGAFGEATPATALEYMLADVRARRVPSSHHTEQAGVTVLACPGERRELEAIAARLRAHLDADPSLRAHELAVWIAGDAERYLAQAPSAFEAAGVPCHLIDAPIDDRGRIGEVVLALLELPTSQMTRSDLLRVMTHPAILAAHPHVDIDDWVRWTERLGIVHGADASAHDGTYLAEHRDKFHWDQGVRRLALGAYMSADRGPAKIAELVVMPEAVRPDQLASAATYALLVRSLASDAAWLADHEATLAEWADIFVALVDAYVDRGSGRGSTTADRSRDVERVRAMLAGIARVDLDGRRVGFREAREHAVRRLVGARADRGEPLAAGVMVAPLRAHRPVPFRVACVVGLAEGEFPRRDETSPLDLRRSAPAMAGDVSPRDADRAAFFEVLLGARDHVYLSYVAAEPKSGQALGPSSVVLELADALAPYVGAASSRDALEQLTIHEPLHRWSGDDPLPAAARARWAVRVRDAIHANLRAAGHPIPDADGMLALLRAGDRPELAALRSELGIVDSLPEPPPPPAQRQLSLASLRSFLESPVQAWAQTVLDLDELPDDTVVDHSDEPFHVERPARAILLREVLAAHLREPLGELADRYDAVVRELALRGQFPVGVFGEAARAVDLRTLERWRAELGPVAVGDATRIGFGRSASQAAELLPALELELAPGRTVRLVGSTELLLRRKGRALSVIAMVGAAEKSSRHHLRGALDHVVLAAAGLAREGHDHVLLSPAGTARRVSHEPWTQGDAIAYLVELIRELVDQPHGYLLPFDVLRRALEGRGPNPGKPPPRRDAFPALGFGPIERPDGLAAPADPFAIARRRFGPLAERMRGDHSFGGGDE